MCPMSGNVGVRLAVVFNGFVIKGAGGGRCANGKPFLYELSSLYFRETIGTIEAHQWHVRVGEEDHSI